MADTVMSHAANPALDRLFDSVHLRIHRTQQVRHEESAHLTLGRATTLLYVARGALYGEVPLATGGAFLTTGRRPAVFETAPGTRLLRAEVDLSTGPFVEALPDRLWVSDFAGAEPAAAALAAVLGDPDAADRCRLSGDPVICRMMVTTVVLSLVRAWAGSECAPDGWPTPAADPFLTRVVDAIHAEPGRDWTVGLLAALGAMSRSVFSERFRRAFGRSPASYVTEVRIGAAKRMLRTGRSVSATAAELGYSSDEGFSRAFRRHTGRTPSSWRMASVA